MINYVRALIFYILIVSLAFFAVIGLYLLFFSPRAHLFLSRGWSYITIRLGRLLCGLDYELKGRENLPTTPAIYLCKHQSAWETLTFFALLPPSCVVLKKELMRLPIFGWGLWITRQIPIDRKAGRSAVDQILSIGKRRLQEGRGIIIFPEGTRVSPHQTAKFHRTGARLAKENQVPLIPVAHNAGSFWPKNSFIKRPGKITVVIGAPIDPAERSIDELNEQAYNWMVNTMREIEPSVV